VGVTVGLIAVYFGLRAFFNFWMLKNVVPIADFFMDDPVISASQFATNARFSIALFSALGVAALICVTGILARWRWVRWIWLVACTVASFSCAFDLLMHPTASFNQFGFLAICVLAWYLLRGNGLSRSIAP
jgi:hypothetical protein